jgi:hypothetical protein
VVKEFQRASRFNGLPARGKPLKRFCRVWPNFTGLKPGVNEIALLVYAKSTIKLI